MDPLQPAAELALVVVHLSVVAGFTRLYRDASFVGVLAGFTLGAHVLAVGSRRLRLPTAIVTVLGLAGAVLAATWLVFPSTAGFGLPTPATWDAATEALRRAGDEFRTVAAPAPVLPGFQLTAGLALWGAVWFADWAAFRLRATVEAVAPATVLFVFGALLGSGRHRFTATVGFLAAVLAFAVLHRAARAGSDRSWATTAPASGPGAVLRAGVGLAVIALGLGTVLGPRIPGSDDDPIVRWRASRSSGGQRTTVSPIVDLRSRLVSQSDVELFRVTSNRRAYWRLTSLDRFDGRLWSSGGQFSPAGTRLSTRAPDIDDGRIISQRIEVDALAAIWVPSAYQARSVRRSSGPLRWDPESSTLIVEASAASSDGLSYQVVSEAPDLDATVLRQAATVDPEALAERYEALPAGFPTIARRSAREATAGATNRYDQARALQDWFRSGFRYSLDVPAGHGDDALVSFLENRVGYCEQFAGAYASMARSLGIPARVAIGFTPGDTDPDDPTFHIVRGRHAHAWPELYFPGAGWVPFEPTPGRGIPDAEQYTGVPEQQDDRVPTISIQTTTTTGTTPGGASSTPGTSSPADEERNRTVAAGPAGTDRPRGSPLRALLWAAIALTGAWLAIVLAAPAVRSARRSRSNGRTVLEAWDESLAPVRWVTRQRPRPAETHGEFARRVAAPLDDLAPVFRRLTTLATRVAWEPTAATAGDADLAAALARELQVAAARRQTPGARIRRRLSWREAFGQAPSPRGSSSAALRPRKRSDDEPK